MKELRLPLKTKWFEMTKKGIKTEDYREINEYWFKRLVFKYKSVYEYCTGLDWEWRHLRHQGICQTALLKKDMIGFIPYDVNIMTLGYPKKDDNSRIVRLKHKGIEVRTGNPEWGAKPDKLYFVIKHGEILTP